MSTYDLVIKKGRLVDGTGNPWMWADIGVKDEKIVKVGRLDQPEADTIIDAAGLVVCPGFIDMHSHSDIVFFVEPLADSMLQQGVTTEFVGNCGSSPSLRMKDGTIYYSDDPLLTWHYPYWGEIKVEWTGIGSYLDRLEEQGIGPNIAPQVGYANLRYYVMGSEDRPPTHEEMEEMKDVMEQAMKEGAFGLSTGVYGVNAYATTEEVIEVCKVVAKYGGIFSTHIRYLWETIEIAEKAKVRTEISHYFEKFGSISGVHSIEEARERGIEIVFDCHIGYKVGGQPLRNYIPNWIKGTNMKKFIKKIGDPEVQRKLREWLSNRRNHPWNRLVIAYSTKPKHKDLVGKTVSEVVEGATDTDLANLAIDDTIRITSLDPYPEESNIISIKHPLCCIGSDGYSLYTNGPLSEWRQYSVDRSFSTYPKLLRLVREGKLVHLEDMIRKMTSLPAQTLGLKDRGLVREGSYADIVVFNPKNVKEKSTLDNPRQYPEGIKCVIVNGQVTVIDGQRTKALAGKGLRHARG